MSQFTSAFWDLYIALIALVSIVACAVFLMLQSARRAPAGSTETTGHVWDEDLGEYNNPMPRWWMWLFYLTVAFSLAYLVLYPGLGGWQGLRKWTSAKQLEEETARFDRRFGPLYAKFARQDLAALAKDPAALATGQKLFLNNCARCHASDGGGARGFPNLTDRDWLWGGELETIRTSIAEGRTGVMPPWGPVLGEQGVKDVAQYVLSLSGGAADSIRRARGEALFKTSCAACHGADGRGNAALGAANLTDEIWLHGSGEEAIIETIGKGRTNQMPAHKELLGEAKIRLLAAYVYSLSAPPK